MALCATCKNPSCSNHAGCKLRWQLRVKTEAAEAAKEKAWADVFTFIGHCMISRDVLMSWHKLAESRAMQILLARISDECARNKGDSLAVTAESVAAMLKQQVNDDKADKAKAG